MAQPARKYARCSCRLLSIAACRPASMLSAMRAKDSPSWIRRNSLSDEIALESSTMLKGKWVLVTGATAGLGLAVAESLAGAGANIVLHDLVEPKATRDALRSRFDVEVVS